MQSVHAESGIEYEIVGDLLVFQPPDCCHWIVWRLNSGARQTPERAADQLLHAIAVRRMHCWKCSEDQWRSREGRRLRHADDTREAALREWDSVQTC